MRRGEVWWVAFDPSIGSEIRKTRPAIIISNDIANHYLARVVVLPLTSNADRVYPGETRASVGGKISKVMADQIMAADKIRLRAKIGELSPFDLKAVEDALALHLGLALKS
ncbi:mRNA interferase MazF [Rhizobium sp. SG_E_25_P2]|uniref:type II toxin-antitoxin system PemK/MazF family toxin n=1 Tax=Rhizobium sp. SG_E_25_P2 TaxID=2879942 RepID=UPI002475269B|nr:type II toxin-antitoxin system PemK/MazF family toxin [Rhizobium sp. SG_E_25_P2]MDH6267913.1 mRNA interferase MazF [Rhizobium sp. SG_E_25_P2]